MEIDVIKLTEKLCEINAISGRERGNSEKLKEAVLPFFDEFSELSYNNYVFIKHGKKGGKKYLFDAHFDQIGLIVTGVEKGGYLRVMSLGGVDVRNLVSNKVTVHGEKKDIPGVVTLSGTDLLPLRLDRMRIYTDMSEDELALAGVGVGCEVSLDGEMRQLKGSKYSCRSLDDRVCGTSIIYAASLLSKDDFAGDMYFLFSCQEESHGVGASTGSFSLSPDVAVAVDVEFGSTPDVDKKDSQGLGNGPTICISTQCDRRLTKKFIKIAAEKEIPLKQMLNPKNTGTNGGHLAFTRAGVPTAVIGVPLRNMHTTLECVDFEDVRTTGKLLAEFVKADSNKESEETK